MNARGATSRRGRSKATTLFSLLIAFFACDCFFSRTGSGKFWAVDAQSYYQQPLNYSLPLCSNSDSSLSCNIADPCVTATNLETSGTTKALITDIAYEDDASATTTFAIDDRFESGDEFFNDFRTYYRLQDETLEKVEFESCPIDTDDKFKEAVDECLSASYPATVAITGDCSLTKWGSMKDWDTSAIKNMAQSFKDKPFNGNITKWDTSQVTTMAEMFASTTNFDQDISKWDTGQVTYMKDMFRFASKFDQGIDDWNVGKVTNMNGMFEGATLFVQDITGWEPGSGCTFEDMFGGDAKFADVYECTAEACEACGNTCGPPSYWETAAGVRSSNF